jgi:hypothetical protein
MSKIYSEKHNARRAAKKALGKAFFEARILPCDNGWTFDEEAPPTQLTNAVDEAELGGMTQAEYEAEQDLAQEALDAGIDPNEGDAQPGEPDCSGIEGSVPDTVPESTARGVKAAAQALLTAWDACPAEDTTDNDISRAIRQLRTALAGKTARAPRQHGTPREGTKQDTVLTLLRRPQGATVAQIAEVTGWAAHTVRGFFAGLKKKGHEIQVLERVRMVGPNKAGAKGSYTVYHLPA